MSLTLCDVSVTKSVCARRSRPRLGGVEQAKSLSRDRIRAPALGSKWRNPQSATVRMGHFPPPAVTRSNTTERPGFMPTSTLSSAGDCAL
jgi:hypothetical protein